MKLPKLKYWGASTSAHQVEGGNHNQWSVWELEHAKLQAKSAEKEFQHWLPDWEEFKDQAQNPNNYVSGKAADFYNRYKDDLKLAKELNLNAFRFSIEWSRVEPEPGKWNHAAIDHYRDMIGYMKDLGIEPFITLWHWTLPTWFTDKGGFAVKANVKDFVTFAQRMAEVLGDELTYIITLNEPNVYAGFGYWQGNWPPGEKSPVKFWRVMNNLAYAHRKTYRVLKKINPNFQIGTAYQASHFYTDKEDIFSRAAVKFSLYFWNDWWLNKVKRQMDYVGFNFYFSDRIHGFQRNNPNLRTNDLGWDMNPRDIRFVIERFYNKYGKPVLIAENGVADHKDQYRKWWIDETVEGIAEAQKAGAKVLGYIHWSLLDNFEWAYGFWPRFGLVEVDYKTQKRTVRPSAKHYASLIKRAKS